MPMRRIRVVTTSEAAAGVRKPGLLWTDVLGRAGIRSAQVLLVLAVIVAVVFATIQLKLVVIPFLLALILAAALSPLVRLLSRVMPRAIAAVLTLLLGAGVFGGVIALIVVNIRSQFDMLRDSVLEGIDAITAFINDGPLPIDQQQIDDAQQGVLDYLASSQFGSGALAGATTVVGLLTGTILALFILFYFLKDGTMIFSFLIRPFRGDMQVRARRAGARAVITLGGYVRGTAVVAFVDAFFIGAALFIFRVPLALPLTILTFVGGFIPIVGATAAGILAALVTLVTVDLTAAIVVTIVVVVVQQVEGNLLQPFVLGRSLSLHGLVVLLALTAGTILGGIVGTLLAVPLTAVAWAIVKSWNEPVPLTPRRGSGLPAAPSAR